MLRITVADAHDSQPVVLHAEGKLRGPWVAELEKCWRSTADSSVGTRVCLDLRGVTSVDENAKTLLSLMVQHGVESRAHNLMMTFVVDQIVSRKEKVKTL